MCRVQVLYPTQRRITPYPTQKGQLKVFTLPETNSKQKYTPENGWFVGIRMNFPFWGASFGSKFSRAICCSFLVVCGVLKIQAVHLVDHHHLGSPWHYRHEIWSPLQDLGSRGFWPNGASGPVRWGENTAGGPPDLSTWHDIAVWLLGGWDLLGMM